MDNKETRVEVFNWYEKGRFISLLVRFGYDPLNVWVSCSQMLK